MKANAIRLYKHFCELVEDPKGADALEKQLCKETAVKAKADMEKHFKTAPKYKNDPEIQALLGEPIPEVNEDAEKPKRRKRNNP